MMSPTCLLLLQNGRMFCFPTVEYYESVCLESLTYQLSREGGAGTRQPWEGRVPLNALIETTGVVIRLPPSSSSFSVAERNIDENVPVPVSKSYIMGSMLF